jgi:hypothetical protein
LHIGNHMNYKKTKRAVTCTGIVQRKFFVWLLISKYRSSKTRVR